MFTLVESTGGRQPLCTKAKNLLFFVSVFVCIFVFHSRFWRFGMDAGHRPLPVYVPRVRPVLRGGQLWWQVPVVQVVVRVRVITLHPHVWYYLIRCVSTLVLWHGRADRRIRLVFGHLVRSDASRRTLTPYEFPRHFYHLRTYAGHYSMNQSRI